MGNIDKSKRTEAQIQKAMACSSVEELMKVAKEEGYELTEDEAKAYFAEMEDFELDGDKLKDVAGGGFAGSQCYAKTGC